MRLRSSQSRTGSVVRGRRGPAAWGVQGGDCAAGLAVSLLVRGGLGSKPNNTRPEKSTPSGVLGTFRRKAIERGSGIPRAPRLIGSLWRAGRRFRRMPFVAIPGPVFGCRSPFGFSGAAHGSLRSESRALPQWCARTRSGRIAAHPTSRMSTRQTAPQPSTAQIALGIDAPQSEAVQSRPIFS
jgi:hypothetical protein